MSDHEVHALRTEIDELDDEIAALVVQRQDLSREIQLMRQAAGGGPIDADRELAVHARYVLQLGAPGEGVAAAVLNACRPDPA